MAFTTWDPGACGCGCTCTPCSLPATTLHLFSSLAGSTAAIPYQGSCLWSNQASPYANGDWFSINCFIFSGLTCTYMHYFHAPGPTDYYWCNNIAGGCGGLPGGRTFIPLTGSSCSPLTINWSAGAIGFHLTP